MASSSARTDQVNEVLASQSPATGGSGGAEILPAPGTEIVQARASNSSALSGAEKHHPLTVAAQIRHSQRHWSELSNSTSTPVSKKPLKFLRSLAARIRGGGRRFEEERAVAIDNRKVFMELQSHPSWGGFFLTFGYTLGTPFPGRPGSTIGSSGSLRVGEKFAEGAQAELFHAQITWNEKYLKMIEWAEEHHVELVLKVFKKGTLLRDLQSQWPLGYLQFQAEDMEKWQSPTYKGFPRFFSGLMCGTLLEDGRFAFVMVREIEDLRSFIDRNMISRSDQDCGPFPKERAEEIIWIIAKGMDWFHSRNIVHRDLKASNVLVGKAIQENSLAYCIADYECSIGVVGTKFFRAPEILQACKDRSIGRKPELFTKAVDVYSYGMTCYEILTGGLPFDGHPQNDYDHVLNGHRPELPPYVDGWKCDLLRRCWDANPTRRPSFAEILSIIVANSLAAQELDSQRQKYVEALGVDFGQGT